MNINATGLCMALSIFAASMSATLRAEDLQDRDSGDHYGLRIVECNTLDRPYYYVQVKLNGDGYYDVYAQTAGYSWLRSNFDGAVGRDRISFQRDSSENIIWLSRVSDNGDYRGSIRLDDVDGLEEGRSIHCKRVDHARKVISCANNNQNSRLRGVEVSRNGNRYWLTINYLNGTEFSSVATGQESSTYAWFNGSGWRLDAVWGEYFWNGSLKDNQGTTHSMFCSKSE